MAKARVGDVVKVQLDARLSDGTVVVTSRGSDPISFRLGAGEVIRGVEKAVVGMVEGESKIATIPPEDAFGRYSGKRLVIMNRAHFPPHIEPATGKLLRLRKANGRTGVVRVAHVDEQQVMIDTNHLLAGREIILEVELLEVSAQTDQNG